MYLESLVSGQRLGTLLFCVLVVPFRDRGLSVFGKVFSPIIEQAFEKGHVKDISEMKRNLDCSLAFLKIPF